MLMPAEVRIGELRRVGERLFGEAQHVHTRVGAVDTTWQLHPRLELGTKRTAMDGRVGGSGSQTVAIHQGHEAQDVSLVEAVVG